MEDSAPAPRDAASADDGTAPASAYRLEEQIGFILRKAQQRHTTIFQELIPGNLTATQFAALVKLAESGPCSQNHLGRLTAMDVATIKGVADRLKARGLVASTADPHDRRRTSLALTAAGRALLEAARPVAFVITERTLEPLTPRERATLQQLLAKIAE
ncbi:MAG: MarR family winged helix-turn-helix transcriptional regulator [Alphaproteobacteria bacterium]